MRGSQVGVLHGLNFLVAVANSRADSSEPKFTDYANPEPRLAASELRERKWPKSPRAPLQKPQPQGELREIGRDLQHLATVACERVALACDAPRSDLRLAWLCSPGPQRALSGNAITASSNRHSRSYVRVLLTGRG